MLFRGHTLIIIRLKLHGSPSLGMGLTLITAEARGWFILDEDSGLLPGCKRRQLLTLVLMSNMTFQAPNLSAPSKAIVELFFALAPLLLRGKLSLISLQSGSPKCSLGQTHFPKWTV